MLVVVYMNEKIDFNNLSVEQLRIVKQDLEKKAKAQVKNITEKKGTLLDQFTSIDDLLRETILALRDLTQDQRETNRQLQIVNKLLLAIYFKEDGNGNIVAANQGLDASAILQEISQGGSRITRVVNLINKQIDGSEIVFQGEFEGQLTEVLFKSETSGTDNDDYGVRIVSDEDIIYQDTYTEFAARQNTETAMAAFEDEINGWYLLQFQDVFFNNKIKVEVYDSSATFLRIYIKYHRTV